MGNTVRTMHRGTGRGRLMWQVQIPMQRTQTLTAPDQGVGALQLAGN